MLNTLNGTQHKSTACHILIFSTLEMEPTPRSFYRFMEIDKLAYKRRAIFQDSLLTVVNKECICTDTLFTCTKAIKSM